MEKTLSTKTPTVNAVNAGQVQDEDEDLEEALSTVSQNQNGSQPKPHQTTTESNSNIDSQIAPDTVDHTFENHGALHPGINQDGTDKGLSKRNGFIYGMESATYSPGPGRQVSSSEEVTVYVNKDQVRFTFVFFSFHFKVPLFRQAYQVRLRYQKPDSEATCVASGVLSSPIVTSVISVQFREADKRNYTEATAAWDVWAERQVNMASTAGPAPRAGSNYGHPQRLYKKKNIC